MTAHRDQKSQRWLLRADSRPHVGFGHVARCLALAEALAGEVEVTVLLDAGSESWVEKYSTEGITVVTCDQLDELPETPRQWHGIVIDGYDFSLSFFDKCSRLTPMLAVIDDFMSPSECAALVINPTPGLARNLIGSVPALTGSDYALIDPAYRDIVIPKNKMQIAQVVVSFGMGDPARSNELVIAALDLIYQDHPGFDVTVAVGAGIPHLTQLKAMADRVKFRLEIKTDVTNMIPLYLTADLVIGAGGVSLLERMACGLPSASLIVADNQAPAICGAAGLGATLNMGEAQSLSPAIAAEKLRPLFENRSLREEMGRQAEKSVDGQGAARAAWSLLLQASQGSA
jgi:UDP-2,4-diacetamido-2,4,6-trideoxy-beta-L-altropyranose hydrolase